MLNSNKMGWLDKQFKHARHSLNKEIHHIERGGERLVRDAESVISSAGHEIQHEAHNILKDAQHIGSSVGKELEDIGDGLETGLSHITDTIPDALGFSNSNNNTNGIDYMNIALLVGSGLGGFYLRNRQQYVLGNALIGAAVGGAVVDIGEYAVGSLPLVSYLEDFDFIKRSEKSSLYLAMLAGAGVGAGVGIMGNVLEGTEQRAVAVAKSSEGKAVASKAASTASDLAPLAGAALLL